MFRVCNMTITFTLSKTLDFSKICLEGSKITKAPKNPDLSGFASLTFKILPHRVTSLLYQTGKVVLLGARSISEALSAANTLCDKLDCSPVTMSDLKVHNQVATLDFGETVHLETLHKFLSGDYDIHFEPELFPSLCWRRKIGTVLFFRSGKVIVTGIKSDKQMNEAIEDIETVFIEYQLEL